MDLVSGGDEGMDATDRGDEPVPLPGPRRLRGSLQVVHEFPVAAAVAGAEGARPGILRVADVRGREVERLAAGDHVQRDPLPTAAAVGGADERAGTVRLAPRHR